ncbi:putative alcohol O-acetyltransferase [Lupinus albus]|uniref:Putative alcohol O-acetyltransferase n=1 Tax=Lupinus albus TaxID=3870 RepID=A0A6A4PJE2_LUPAL|nr:putative alcohol O-acetyltransferase [Lupinus albus]
MTMMTLTYSFLPSKPFRSPIYNRPRLKLLTVRAQSEINVFETLTLFHSFNFIAPVLAAFASGFALSLSRRRNNTNSDSIDLGEWILFANPSPFNRFVFLRCPTISFRDEDANQRLVREEKHYVTLNNGRIRLKLDDESDKKVSYQRVCVSGGDGGVISLDWPINLDLEQEHGLDSTILLVPGTPQGSMDPTVMSFVVEALKKGYFPIVMNPRGCAASPITTPRLFTAADSDDICTAVTYICKARPWTTLMGVGWGYGANMLTKYLAEVGETTPLTAATCIDNPFDLDEATRSSPYHIVIDQKLTDGLKDILQANKALFQGKTKGFDVEKALLANSVREFEEAISMVSYGFEDIEGFYSKSSTRNIIKDVKIPVLFIQSDNVMVPVFSVPRNLIAENPFTSLLLCSCLPASVIETDTDMSAISWCQLLTTEWLTAVELGLLKGRHPLLTDIDVTINPSNGLTVVEEMRSAKNAKVSNLLDVARPDAFNGYTIDPTNEFLEERKTDDNFHFRSEHDLQRNLQHEDMSLQVKHGPSQETSSIDADLVEENVGPADNEHGHVLQTAKLVTNMLDVTMPGTLTEEQKKKVLTAVGQGETLMKALEDAVPEDVRGKLTDAVTGILHARGADLKFDRVLGISQGLEGLTGQKNQEKFRGVSGVFGDLSSLNQMKKTSSSVDASDNAPSDRVESAEETETDVLPLDKLPNSTSLAQSQEPNNEVGSSNSFWSETGNSGDNIDADTELKEKGIPDIDHIEKDVETGSKPYIPRTSHSDGVAGEEAAVVEQKNQNNGMGQSDTMEENNSQKVEQKSQASSSDQSKVTSTDEKEDTCSSPMSSDNEMAQSDTEENNVQKVEKKSQDFSSDQSKTKTSDAKEELSSSPVPFEHHTIERESNDNEKKDSINTQQSNSTTSNSSAATFNVSQALDAFTGMDDSTQVAVNSVYGVLENMLSQLEQSSVNEGEVKDGKDVEHSSVNEGQVKEGKDVEHSSVNEGQVKDGKDVEIKLEEQQKSNSQSMDSNLSDDLCGDDQQNGIYLKNDYCHTEEQLPHSLNTINGSSLFSAQNSNSKDHLVQNENTASEVIDKTYLVHKWDENKHSNRIPPYIALGSYRDSLYSEYIRKNLVSKVPTKPLDLHTTTTLLLDYFPEEGQWKLFEQPQNMEIASGSTAASDEAGSKMKTHSSTKSSVVKQYMGPPYVILDTESQQEHVKELITTDTIHKMIDTSDDRSKELILFVKVVVLGSLKMEVGRKLNAAEIKMMKPKLAGDLEHVANAISLAVVHSNVQQPCTERQACNVEDTVEKVGTLDGEYLIRVITSSVQETRYLTRIMPVGVVVGSILAALMKYFNVATLEDSHRGSVTCGDGGKPSKKYYGNVGVRELNQVPGEKSSLDHPIKREAAERGPLTPDDGVKPGKKNYGHVGVTDIDEAHEEKTSFDHPMKTEVESELEYGSKNSAMVGAVTAALGASALFMQKGPQEGNETDEISSTSLEMKDHHQKNPEELEVEVSEKNQNNIVTSLAEKAMSVAAPVVPTKDGEVDQERLVAMLASFGQRGGLLRLVGKIALLWGGIRGAMSLTDRLISFLRIAERPLFQRILGFVGMILVLWSPVAIPLLPTLVQSWTTKTPSIVAEFACIVGLYAAIMILVMLWGKRVHGYENSYEQYGLVLTSSRKLFEFLKGLVGGVILVFSIHAVNAFLGCISFSWPLTQTSMDAMTLLKVCGQMGLIVVQGTVMASAIALVEELLFRSWLPQEIAVDLGYHRGIIISGLAFSLSQRSLQAIPGLWLLSLFLSGVRHRNGGSLSMPIGLRAGIMASSFILQKGGFLAYNNYNGNFTLWITGSHPFQPFSGLVGLLFSLSLAILLYPRQTSQKREA